MGKAARCAFMVVYGEEGGSGKTFMVHEGVFDDVDAALTAPGSLCRYVQYPHAGKTFRHHGALKRRLHMPRTPLFGTQRP